LTQAKGEEATVDVERREFEHSLLATTPRLLAFGRRLAGDADEARDLVQDTLEQALTSRGQFVPGTNLQAWLNRILRNKHLAKVGRRARERRYALEGANSANYCNPAQEPALALRRIASALSAMPTPVANAVLFVGVQGASYDEAAVALGLKVGTVKSRVARARRRLAEILDGSSEPCRKKSAGKTT
jgi:RNA polymerase sigma-70 factor, ECF subfamily